MKFIEAAATLIIIITVIGLSLALSNLMQDSWGNTTASMEANKVCQLRGCPRSTITDDGIVCYKYQKSCIENTEVCKNKVKVCEKIPWNEVRG